MSRTLIVIALVGLLVSCTTQGDGEPDGSIEAPASAAASASAGTSGTASAACTEAFAPLVDMDISSMSQLGELAEEVQPTVEACESVADWIAGARQVIGGEVNPGSADFLLRVHCEDLSLARTQICEELG